MAMTATFSSPSMKRGCFVDTTVGLVNLSIKTGISVDARTELRLLSTNRRVLVENLIDLMHLSTKRAVLMDKHRLRRMGSGTKQDIRVMPEGKT